MQTRIFNLFNQHQDCFTGLKSELSFDGFIAHLKKLSSKSNPGKQEMLKFMLNKFILAQKIHGSLNHTNIEKFSSELYLIYSLMVPLLLDERKMVWGLSVPVTGEIFYGTDTFYEFLEAESEQPGDLTNMHLHSRSDLKLQFIYALILERLYGFPFLSSEPLVYSREDKSTGLPAYYNISVDNTFVNVKYQGELPPIDYERFRKKGIQNIQWSEFPAILPLDNFQIEGFSIITVSDNGNEQVMKKIRNIVIRRPDCEASINRHELEQSLQSLTGNPHLHFGLTPLFKLNGSPVIEPKMASDSILFNQLINKNDGTPIVSLVKEYLENPYAIIYNVFSDQTDYYSNLLKEIVKLDITSYVCIPLYYNNEVVGLLEIHTESEEYLISKGELAKLRPATPLLAQLAFDLIHEFRNRIDGIIKERFTSIQPSVQWKFNNAAWQCLLNENASGSKASISDIQFNNVFPLYGAIDISDSTNIRNKAQYLDLKIQLQLLRDTLESAWQASHWEVVENILEKCKNWQNELDIHQIDMQQISITEFLNKDVSDLLSNIQNQYPALKAVIEKYETETAPDSGFCYSQRRAFEASLTKINQTIASHLDSLNAEIQDCYPSYFEKFRTDGIEFDIYAGQSIHPDVKFENRHLQQIQYLQLAFVATIARATHSLKPMLPVQLDTTQLIFVNSNEIDINFRVDERRFDVEGSYNVRYHIIKKRIDKVMVKNTHERLTQSGKIALVYLHENSVRNYYTYIKRLQAEGLLLDDLEVLELNELQGVHGLKALRVSVNPGSEMPSSQQITNEYILG